MGTPPRVDPNQAGIKTIDTMTVTSVRQSAGMYNVSPPVVRRWLSVGLIPAPPWTRAHCWRFATSQIPTDDDAAIVGCTAPSQDGTRDAAAPDAANT